MVKCVYICRVIIEEGIVLHWLYFAHTLLYVV